MGNGNNEDQITFGDYIRKHRNQELKAILLKLKNEIKKDDLLWEELKPMLSTLYRKDDRTLIEILPFLLQD